MGLSPPDDGAAPSRAGGKDTGVGSRTVLVLDSGIGGLGIATELRALRPDAPITYLADNAGFPYGDLAPGTLCARLTTLLAEAMACLQPGLVVVACNTASVVALAALRARFAVPFVGCVPAVKLAAALSRTRCFGLLATPATVSRPYVADLVARFAPDCTVLSHGARHLAALAERRFAGLPVDPRALAAELQGLLGQPGAERMDTVVLGCTHYRLLLPELCRVAPGLVWLDPAPAVARRASELLGPAGTSGTERPPGRSSTVLLTRRPAEPRLVARRFLQHGFGALGLLHGGRIEPLVGAAVAP